MQACKPFLRFFFALNNGKTMNRPFRTAYFRVGGHGFRSAGQLPQAWLPRGSPATIQGDRLFLFYDMQITHSIIPFLNNTIMDSNRIRHDQLVKVEVTDDNGRTVATHLCDTVNTITQAIQQTIAAVALPGPAVDYVYRVTDLSTGVSERYRLNAGGHVRLLS